MPHSGSGVPLCSLIPIPEEHIFPGETLSDHFHFPNWAFESSPYTKLGSLEVGSTFDKFVVGCTITKSGLTVLGKPFVRCSVHDRSDRFPAVLWAKSKAEAERFSELVTTAGVIEVSGYVQEFPRGSGRYQLNIQTYNSTTVEPQAVLPVAYPKYNVYNETAFLFSVLKDLREPLGSVGRSILKSNWPSFCIAPAAKYYHHAFASGLLVHTAQVTRLVFYVTQDQSNYIDRIEDITFRFIRLLTASLHTVHPNSSLGRVLSTDHLLSIVVHLDEISQTEHQLDKDLCRLGAVLHDIGKIHEYKLSNQIELDPKGQLLGHIYSGASLVHTSSVDAGLPPEDLLHLEHLILSHHGATEFGSPVRPLTPEAIILHWADYIASRCT